MKRCHSVSSHSLGGVFKWSDRAYNLRSVTTYLACFNYSMVQSLSKPIVLLCGT